MYPLRFQKAVVGYFCFKNLRTYSVLKSRLPNCKSKTPKLNIGGEYKR
jgi:hypothetical protein